MKNNKSESTDAEEAADWGLYFGGGSSNGCKDVDSGKCSCKESLDEIFWLTLFVIQLLTYYIACVQFKVVAMVLTYRVRK